MLPVKQIQPQATPSQFLSIIRFYLRDQQLDWFRSVNLEAAQTTFEKKY